jgi:hypothetical protein
MCAVCACFTMRASMSVALRFWAVDFGGIVLQCVQCVCAISAMAIMSDLVQGLGSPRIFFQTLT